MSLFVGATDTEVGKTVVSALLVRRFRVGYWKPVATGAATDRDLETVRQLAGEGARLEPEVFLYDPPVSPHLAARRAGRPVRTSEILARWRDLEPQGPWVVEGIGGLLVPLAEDPPRLLLDLWPGWSLPVLLVARSTLGTINHTLLSLEALDRRGIPCIGVVLVGRPDDENRHAIERFGGVEVVAEIPPIEPLVPAAVELHAERVAALAPWLSTGFA